MDDRQANHRKKHPGSFGFAANRVVEGLKNSKSNNVKADDSFLHVRICIHPRVMLWIWTIFCRVGRSDQMILSEIGHFRVPLRLCIKVSLFAKPLI